MGYAPSQVINLANLVNPNAKELVVIFFPWHSGGKLLDIFVNRLSKRYAVLVYEFNDDIIGPNINQVISSY